MFWKVTGEEGHTNEVNIYTLRSTVSFGYMVWNEDPKIFDSHIQILAKIDITHP